MRWVRSTPTAPSCVVSTVWQPAARPVKRDAISRLRIMCVLLETISFQRHCKKQADDTGGRGQRKREAGAPSLPRPAREEGAGRAAGAVSHAGIKRLSPGMRRFGEHTVHRRNGRGMESAERRRVQHLRQKDYPEGLGKPADGEKAHHGAGEAEGQDARQRESLE